MAACCRKSTTAAATSAAGSHIWWIVEDFMERCLATSCGGDLPGKDYFACACAAHHSSSRTGRRVRFAVMFAIFPSRR